MRRPLSVAAILAMLGIAAACSAPGDPKGSPDGPVHYTSAGPTALPSSTGGVLTGGASQPGQSPSRTEPPCPLAAGQMPTKADTYGLLTAADLTTITGHGYQLQSCSEGPVSMTQRNYSPILPTDTQYPVVHFTVAKGRDVATIWQAGLSYRSSYAMLTKGKVADKLSITGSITALCFCKGADTSRWMMLSVSLTDQQRDTIDTLARDEHIIFWALETARRRL